MDGAINWIRSTKPRRRAGGRWEDIVERHHLSVKTVKTGSILIHFIRVCLVTTRQGVIKRKSKKKADKSQGKEEAHPLLSLVLTQFKSPVKGE